MQPDDIVIVAARRTPIGAFQGALAGASATALGGTAIAAAVADAGVPGDAVDQALMGCVLSAGLGQAPARQAVLAAGLPVGVPCTTVNKMCGSGLMAIMLGHDLIRAGSAGIVVAGGLESMTNAPYLLPGARAGYRMGHQEILDHMFFDGLQDPYEGKMMGHFAEQTARKYGFGRKAQDEFAIESVTRAQAALANGAFDAEVAPVTISTRKGESLVASDETPGTVNIERIPRLKRRVRRRWHRDCGELVLDLGRRGRNGADVGAGSRSARHRARSLASPATRARHSSPRGSRRRRYPRSHACTKASAGARRMSTCTKLTRLSPS